MNLDDLLSRITNLLNNKKGENIEIIKISDLSILADYFIIVSGNSNTHVKALSEEVEDKMSEIGIEPKRIEGKSSGNWILMDYEDVIIHIFYKETREFYDIGRLWADAPRIDINSIIKD